MHQHLLDLIKLHRTIPKEEPIEFGILAPASLINSIDNSITIISIRSGKGNVSFIAAIENSKSVGSSDT